MIAYDIMSHTTLQGLDSEGFDCPSSGPIELWAFFQGKRAAVTDPLRHHDLRCYLISMSRLTTLLILFALIFTNGPALASAMCRHGDATSHEAALQNTDIHISIVAQGEDASAEALSKRGTPGNAATSLLSGYILPHPVSLVPRLAAPSIDHVGAMAGLYGRSVRPLLEPPLG